MEKIRILLVDDDLNIQRFYGKLLRDEGYETFQALDAERATEILITQPIDLILLDINLPGIDGSAFRQIMEEFDNRIKVIVTSVCPVTEQRKRIRRVDEYFDKAHGTELLLQIIHQVLGETQRKEDEK